MVQILNTVRWTRARHPIKYDSLSYQNVSLWMHPLCSKGLVKSDHDREQMDNGLIIYMVEKQYSLSVHCRKHSDWQKKKFFQIRTISW